MNKSSVSDKQDTNCVVCCRRLTIFAIGECDHPICYQCATRMRVLCKQNDCAICRKELPKMIFCNQKLPYRELKDTNFSLKDSRHKLYFQDIDIQKAFYKLLENPCQFCESRPTYANFHSLKEHVRKEHERHFCDLCVEHLMIFTFERKCYTRTDLARHRRLGDLDDKSHRGHPLCEFCDTRFLDEDELYKHLRREHFYCHFCDADGLHHYYSDYEYLREHFRQEHYLCEEGDCINDKFTTVFRSEIDLKAHRTSVHNKLLSKAQMKQARTLELEFSIAPRNIQPRQPGHHHRENRDSDLGASGESSENRGGFRRGYRRGENRDDFRARRHNDEVDVVATTKPPPVSPKIDMNDSQAFPSLSVQPNVTTSDTCSGGSSGSSADTMAQKIAKINRFSVGKKNINGDEEFPALAPSSNGKMTSEAKKTSKSDRVSMKPPTSWGASTSAMVTLSSSSEPVGTNFTKKTVTLKLNSKEEFPGLQVNSKRFPGPSSVSFHMTHNVKPVIQQSGNSSGALINTPQPKKSEEGASANSNNGKSKQPVVTRVTSTQNIRFIDSLPPNNVVTAEEATPKDDTDSNNLSRTESGWYVLKKGKCKKTDEPTFQERQKSNVMNVSSKEEFPDLETGKLKMRFKESTTVPTSSVWKTSNNRSDIDIEAGEPSKGAGKKKKKLKDQANINDNTANSSGIVNDSGKKKKKSQTSTFERLKKLIETQEMLIRETEDSDEKSIEKFESSTADEQSENERGSLFNSDEWPEVSEQKPNSGQPPPGFESVHQNRVNPPPGFASSVTKPPPGFRSPLSMLNNGQASTAITFTNSSGQDFPLTSNNVNLEYTPLPQFNERNKQLMSKIVNLFGGENEQFMLFVETSVKFRRSEISALDYYQFCMEIMGKNEFVEIFSELLVLLPDIDKQHELFGAYTEINRRTSKNKSENSLLFLICTACRQVLCSKDFQIHEREHDALH